MAEQTAVGVDIGGTKIALALVTEAGNVLASERLPTRTDESPAQTMERIAEAIHALAKHVDIWPAGVGIGSPGHVDPITGIVRGAVNMGWDEVHLRAGIQERLPTQTPVFLQKDANASALAEKFYGAGQGCKDFIYLGVGTGLGGGAVVDDQLVVGGSAYAMEVGHLALVPNGRLCACGLHGCPEMYLAGVGLLAGIKEHAAQFPETSLASAVVTTEMLLDAASKGDALARLVMDEALHWFVMVLSYCAVLFNPSLFIVGGGLGHAASDIYIDAAGRELPKRVPPATRQNLRIVQSQISDSAVGAACLVWHAQKAPLMTE
jgi:glucokinase